MTPTRYKMLKDSTIDPSVKEGHPVYRCINYDYGLAADDTAFTGVKHISVTLQPDGGYPYFTVPERDLELVQDVDDGLTLIRVQQLIGLCSYPDTNPRFHHAACGIMSQYLAQRAEEGSMRRVPRYENTAATLREAAVHEFSLAVKHGFIDC